MGRAVAVRASGTRRSALWGAGISTAVALIAVVGSVLFRPVGMGARDWQIVAVLAVVGLLSTVLGRLMRPTDDPTAPPWEVYTVWLWPAAFLLPPAGFLPLVALAVLVTASRQSVPVPWRINIGCVTVVTTAYVHLIVTVVPSVALAAILAIVGHWVIGAVAAVLIASTFGSPESTVLWLDPRWSLVELGCCFCGVLIAVTMRSEAILGLAGIAPALLSSFALRWPELNRTVGLDAKTGLPNAHTWEVRTRDLLADAGVQRLPVAVMIVDLDHFKEINDTFGHLVGDQALIGTARTLRDALRPGDLLGRFGGEEFVVTAMDVDGAAADRYAEQLRQRVAEVAHEFRDRQDGGMVSRRVTCTIGVAATADHGYDARQLLDRADGALAAGKAAGRDRVAHAGRLDEVFADTATRAAAETRPRAAVWTMIRSRLLNRQSDRSR